MVVKNDNGLSNCRVCDHHAVDLCFELNKMPINIWPLQPRKKEIFSDILVFNCLHCGHIQLQNFSESFISSLYADYGFINNDSIPKPVRFKLVQDYYGAENLLASRILDVGGGVNSIIEQFGEKAEKWVVDFSIAEETKKEANYFLQGDFLKIDLPKNSFDYIFLFHCLEHMNQPRQVVEKLRSLIKDDGRILVEVPNFLWYVENLPYYALFHQHLNMFYRETLQLIFEDFNLFIENIFLNDQVLFFSFKKRPSMTRSKECLLPNKKGIMGLWNLKRNLGQIDLFLENNFSYYKYKKTNLYSAGGSSKLFITHFRKYLDCFDISLDKDEKKHGRYLFDGRIPVFPIEKLDQYNENPLLFLNKDHQKGITPKPGIDLVDLKW